MSERKNSAVVIYFATVNRFPINTVEDGMPGNTVNIVAIKTFLT